MRARGTILLAVAGILAILGGWYFGTATKPAEQTSLPAGALMYPDLAPKLAGSAKLRIVHQGKPLEIEKRPDGAWGVAALHDYPVQETKLRGMLTALTELRLTEARTSDPASLGRLGLDDPMSPTSNGTLLQVMGADGTPVVDMVVGHRRVRTQGNGGEDVYVRRNGDNQSWLAESGLQVDSDASLWLDRSILDIGHDKIARVVVGDNALVFEAKDGKLALTRPAERAKLDDYKVEDVGRALEMLTLQAVKADADLTAEEAGRSVFTTTDGLAVTVQVLHADKDVWARFAVSGPDAVKDQVAGLNARLSGWSYQLGSWKEQALVPTLKGIEAEAPAPPANQASAPDPAAAAAPK